VFKGVVPLEQIAPAFIATARSIVWVTVDTASAPSRTAT
jgi:hypothetical protein